MSKGHLIYSQESQEPTADQDSLELNGDAAKSFSGTQYSTNYDGNISDLRNRAIRKSEILSATYNKWQLKLLLLVCAFIIGYGYGLNSSVYYSYTSYALADLEAAQLTSTVNVVNAVIGAASQLGYSRIADLSGRFYVLIAALIFYVIGILVMSQATDVAKYATGSIFYTLGYDGIILLMVLVMSDNSSLKWRLFFIAAPTWPYIINNWISQPIINAAVPKDNWKWDIAMWAFIFPLSAIPFICCLLHQWWLASKTDEWKAIQEEEKVFARNITFKRVLEIIFWEVDLVGAFLTAIVLGCILVPITLAGGFDSKWHNPKILAPFVLGFVLLPFLLYWEGKFAKYPLVPYRLVKDRGLWAAMACSFFVSFEAYVTDEYLYEVLIINVNESAGMATTINGLNTFVSTAFSPVFFYALTFMSRLKPTIIVGIGLWFIERGLVLHFRQGHVARAGIIAGRIIGGFGTTLLTDPINVSAMASVDHTLMATATALCYTTYRIGGAVGSAIGGAIVTENFYKKLIEHGLNTDTAKLVYSEGIAIISEFPWGSTSRQQIMDALSEVQYILAVVAIVFLAPMILIACCLRDPRLTHEQAHKLGRGQIVAEDETDPIYDVLAWPIRKLMGRPCHISSFRAQNEAHSDEEYSDKESTA